MKTVLSLIKRNVKMFFKDKALFFTSMITPMILLLLYVTFLGNVYRDSFSSILAGTGASNDTVSGLVAGQLVSSLLAVSCVTVAFCSNMLMVQDKISGAYGDFRVSPVRPAAMAVSYFAASAVSTLSVSLFAAGLGLVYIAAVGWYLSAADVIMIVADVCILALFGTGLSSIVNSFLTSQGQISAVGSIVSSCYGFICGAYMPISQFSNGLASVLSCLPGTYGTALLRNHAMRGAVKALAESDGVGEYNIELIEKNFDMRIDFFGNEVGEPVMLAVICGATAAACAAYILICVIRGRKHKKA